MIKKIKVILLLFLLILMNLSALASFATSVRIKDVTHIDGIRENQLVGYGIVVGLPGTGDNSRSTQITNQAMLSNLGTVITNSNDIKKGNTAAVIITAKVPPFAKSGDKIDIIVSSLADAKSLEGGVLVQAQLLAPNGEVIAMAQGPVSTGGTDISAGGSRVKTTISTSGRIPNGAIIERDINTPIGGEESLKLVLNRSDFTMAARITQTVNDNLAKARALDGNTIKIMIPEKFRSNKIGFISILENLRVDTTENAASVVINERTGTIVIGSEVKLLPAAVAHGNLTVTVKSVNEVSQPNAMGEGNTEVVQNAEISVDKQPGNVVELGSNANLSELVTALNSIGVSPYDLISILQALKAAGSLQASLEII